MSDVNPVQIPLTPAQLREERRAEAMRQNLLKRKAWQQAIKLEQKDPSPLPTPETQEEGIDHAHHE